MEEIGNIVRKLLDIAYYQDGNATIPAYMLEQLAVAAEVLDLKDTSYLEK